MTEQYVPVRQDLPCPVCGSTKWCLIHRSGKKVICPHTKSNQKYGDENYLHNVHGERAVQIAALVAREPQYNIEDIDWFRRFKDLQEKEDMNVKVWFAEHLGVTMRVLNQYLVVAHLHPDGGPLLGCPMQDGAGTLTGVQNRDAEGGKRFIKGSKNGLFVPVGLVPNEIYVCEGFSDSAANYSAGNYSIGRVSAKTGYEAVTKFVRLNPHITTVHVVADNDVECLRGNVGVTGAKRLQFILSGLVNADVVVPHEYNDVRESWNEANQVVLRPVE